MKKILTLLMVITAFFSLSTVVAADSIYVVGMDTTQYNDLVPEGFSIIDYSPMTYIHANKYGFLSKDSSKYINLSIGIHQNNNKGVYLIEKYLKAASNSSFCQDTPTRVGLISWSFNNSNEIYFLRNNVFLRISSNGMDVMKIAHNIDDLIINQKPPFKYAKTPPSAPTPKIPKQIKNNEDNWKALFKDYSGWYEVVTNGQAIYRKDPENNKETFELARKTGKVKLTIKATTDDNLFYTKEVETEIVP